MVEVILQLLRTQRLEPERRRANDDVLALEPGRFQTFEKVPNTLVCRDRRRRSKRQPILSGELLSELDSVSRYPRVVRSTTNPTPHLRSQFEDFAVNLAPRHGRNRGELRQPAFWIPCQCLELILILELGVQPL